MIDILLSPFQFSFMNNAMIIAMLISVPAALLSCFLVLKGWALLGDAISHAVLPGVVIAYIINIPLVVGAFIAGMVCALASGYLQENSRVKQDTVMGVVFSGMFGLGIVLYTKIQSDVHLDHILFGNIQGVNLRDILFTGAIALFVTAVLLFKRKDFMLHAFDPAHARVMGLSVRLLHYGLLALISLTIVAALKAVGIILTIALLIAPGAIAFLLTRRFDAMALVAVVLSLCASFTGVYASFFIDSAPAPTIVLVLTLVFVLAFVANTRKTKHAKPL